MRTSSLLSAFLLPLLIACPPDRVDDDDTGPDDDDDACADPAGRASLCDYVGAFPMDTPVTGSFGSWGDGDVDFTAADGTVYELALDLSGPAVDVIPDLAAFGTVTLTLSGGCDGKGGAYSSALVESPGVPVFTLAAFGVLAPFSGGGLSVAAEASDCEAVAASWCGCWARCRPDRLVFGDGASTVSLLQGEDAELGSYFVHAFYAFTGQEPDCSDTADQVRAWAIVRDPDDPGPIGR